MLKNKKAITTAFDWDMIAKCCHYLIAYIWELDFDITCQWGCDEMSELVTPSTTERQAYINILNWVRYRCEFEKRRLLL